MLPFDEHTVARFEFPKGGHHRGVLALSWLERKPTLLLVTILTHLFVLHI